MIKTYLVSERPMINLCDSCVGCVWHWNQGEEAIAVVGCTRWEKKKSENASDGSSGAESKTVSNVSQEGTGLVESSGEIELGSEGSVSSSSES